MTTIHHIHAYDTSNHVDVTPQPFSISLCLHIGRALIEFTKANKVVIGNTNEQLSPDIHKALVNGLNQQGANVIDIGFCNEEQLYFATRHYNAKASVLIGNVLENDILALKHFTFFNHKAQPINESNGLLTIWSLAGQHAFDCDRVSGSYQQQDIANHYLMNVLSILNCLAPKPLHKMKALTAVISCSNKATLKLIEHLNALLAVHRINIEIIQSQSQDLSHSILQHQADVGVSYNQFNGCDIYTEQGQMINHQQVSQLLSDLFEGKYTNMTVVADNYNSYQAPNYWQIQQNNQTIQRTMANSNAMYGSSNNGHHFFQHLGFAPSQILPWLLSLLACIKSESSISELTEQAITQDNNAEPQTLSA